VAATARTQKMSFLRGELEIMSLLEYCNYCKGFAPGLVGQTFGTSEAERIRPNL